MSAADLRLAEDEGIRRVVRMQEEIGLQAATDGEFRRASWHMDFLYQIGGVTKAVDSMKVQFHNEKGDIEFTPAALHVNGKLKYEKMHFRRGFSVSQIGGKSDAEAHDPFAEHAALSRRPRGH